MPFTCDEERWRAIQARDAQADGCFVYAVRSTHIYCRPNCKARLPRRANVSYYETATDADVAGFRPCKRCKPDMGDSMPDEDGVRKVKAYMACHVGEQGVDAWAGPTMSLSQMARRTGMSKWHFHRVFKKCVGMTPAEYVRSRRLAASPGSTAAPPTPVDAAPSLCDTGSTPATSLGMDDWLRQMGDATTCASAAYPAADTPSGDLPSAGCGSPLDGALDDFDSWFDLVVLPNNDFTWEYGDEGKVEWS